MRAVLRDAREKTLPLYRVVEVDIRNDMPLSGKLPVYLHRRKPELVTAIVVPKQKKAVDT